MPVYSKQEKVTEFLDMSDFTASRLIQLNSCGYEHVNNYDYTILRSRGRSDYHILYLTSGYIDAEIGTQKVRINSGQCAVWNPGVRQMYSYTVEGGTSTFYLHFTGAAVEEAMHFIAPASPPVFTISEQTSFECLLRQIQQVHLVKANNYILEENALLMQIISAVAKSSNSAPPPIRKDILCAMEYIKTHLSEDFSVEQFAASVNLSSSRFSHLFTKTVGISPYQYLTRLRLERAQAYLQDSTMSITEISDTIGFSDPLYFSRIFRKTYGLSPKAYRDSFRRKYQL